MKKILLLGLSSMLVGTAFAQTEKSSTYLGANVGNLSYRNDGGSNELAVNVYPTAGIFLADNLLLGTGVQVGYERLSFDNSTQKYRGHTTTLGLLPFVRYYLPGTGSHRFFGQAQGGVVWTSSRVTIDYNTGEDDERKAKSHDSAFGAALGYNYFLTPGAALEITAGYRRDTNGPERTIGLLDIRAGLAVFLRGKQATIPAQ
ncbi:outer membrane beta-barrel protein [Hymenobacter glacieicola]|nr:outer membrane beta-barrel protein [Hymenobacter glacieicola]